MVSFEKYERDGEVAVLYSPGFGAGWYSWSDDSLTGLLFDKEIVEAVLAGDKTKAAKIAKTKYGKGGNHVCVLGAHDLEIFWVPKGEEFEVVEYDGSESVNVIGRMKRLVA